MPGHDPTPKDPQRTWAELEPTLIALLTPEVVGKLNEAQRAADPAEREKEVRRVLMARAAELEQEEE